MKVILKASSVVFALLLLFTGVTEAQGAAVNTSKSRVTYTLDDSSGVRYAIYFIPTNEKKSIGSCNSKYSWSSCWAGVNQGDTIYHGDYKIYQRKAGSKTVKYTGYQKKDFTYNATRKMVYSVPSKYKGQPDLFITAETMSSNFEDGRIYYMFKGKLKKADLFAYTYRPQNVGKHSFRTAGYNNGDGKWYIRDYKLSVINGKLRETKLFVKRYDMDKFRKSWRKDWK
ncbi:hypothetical protein [Peribacillus glennii]|uniref:Uncharacterized protein n=1 Tax=Peribacillus glennii TaxID=2303991 RepID=A0A372L7P7_9BACI|nr:hypothetical protein [Peribacillus glennii]RFU61288.1 hypothetical protein D0466_18940 [Peribacillus glennii]